MLDCAGAFFGSGIPHRLQGSVPELKTPKNNKNYLTVFNSLKHCQPVWVVFRRRHHARRLLNVVSKTNVFSYDTIEMEELLNKIDVRQEHTAAAVPPQTKRIQSLTTDKNHYKTRIQVTNLLYPSV